MLGRELGRGAMGTVHAAVDPELDRHVAIKLLQVDASPGRSRASFLREAQATAQLNHRNVVTIHDVGIVGDQLFLAMELIDGPTLRTWLQGDRSWREVRAVMCDAGAGLVAAHDAGIVHRDFKPDNVLLAAAPPGSDAGVRVVVTDFGLARRALETTMTDVSLADVSLADVSLGSVPMDATHDGAFQGTAAYAAPEQQRGGACDARSDQFSFCVTLYEALWGRRPFEGETADQVLDAMEAGGVRTPTGAARVPAGLRRAVMRGLSAAPERRFADMRALLAAISPRRRSPLGVGMAVGTATAMVAAVAVFGSTGPIDPEHTRYCDRTASRLEGVWDDAVRTDIEAAFIATGEPSASGTWSATSASLDGFATTWVATQDATCRAGEQGAVPTGVLLRRTACLDRLLDHAQGLTEALRNADGPMVLRATEIVAKLASPHDCVDDRLLSRSAAARSHVDAATREALDAMIARGEVLCHTGKYDECERSSIEALGKARAAVDRWAEAEALLRTAVAQQWQQVPSTEQTYHDALSAALSVDHHRVAALAMVGLVEQWNPDTEGGVARAEQWHRHCSATISAMGGAPSLEIELSVGLGNVYLTSGQFDRAQELYEHALSLRRVASDDVLLAGAHANIGSIEAARGRYREALDRFRRARDAIAGGYGPRHPGVAAATSNIGSALAELGDLEGARDVHLEALGILEENFGEDHTTLAPALRMLAWNGLARREFADALPFAQRALAIARRDSAEHSESVARSLSMLASIHAEMRRFDEGDAMAREALEIIRALYPDGHPTLATFEIDAGVAAIGVGADAAAREHLGRAIESRERSLGAHDSEVGRAWSMLAELELQRGRGTAAIAAADRAFEIVTHPGNERGGAGPEVTFLLARSLMAGGDAADRARARILAREAAAGFATVGSGWRGRSDEVIAWADAARTD